MLSDIFTYDGGSSLSFVIAGIFVGIVIASLLMLYNIRVPGKMVRALLKAHADSPEKALTAEQLGFKNEFLLKSMMSESGALAKYIQIIPTKQIKKGKKTVPVYSSARYFLIPETRIRASIRYDKRNANTVTVVVGIVLFALLSLALLYVIPDLLQMLKNFIGMFSNK